MLAVLVLLAITSFGTHGGGRYCPRRVASPPVETVVQKFGGTSVADADRIREVADRAGVSVGTVSNTINHPERVSPATQTAVRDAIADLGFVPHAAERHPHELDRVVAWSKVA